MIWTDGSGCDDLRIEENLHQCKKCASIFYTKEAEIVGIDNIDCIVKNGCFIEGGRKVNEFYSNFNIPSLNGFIGSSIKHKKLNRHYIPLKGMPPNFNGFSEDREFMACANSIDYVRAISLKLFSSLDDELDLRIKAWWSDKFSSEDIRLIALKGFKECNSEDNELLRSSSLPIEAENNIRRMLDIIDLSPKYSVDYLPYKIMRSDMLRRLGLFDECANFLKSNTEQSDLDRLEYKYAIETIFLSCKERIRCARRTGFERPWASGPDFYV
ncbi:hypothetical protein A1342_12150 [Methylomonas methanica]|uniref:Uncharacterized protein n=2 Tax=Methylomonas TaxID=416 RepID=A0A126T698_9GAMM|nr:hypothetical protein JT25_013985 [Methylomonas denitrificans]OAI05158.1 hypothetical protein A1342_12150 [Methylomonas methanica]